MFVQLHPPCVSALASAFQGITHREPLMSLLYAVLCVSLPITPHSHLHQSPSLTAHTYMHLLSSPSSAACTCASCHPAACHVAIMQHATCSTDTQHMQHNTEMVHTPASTCEATAAWSGAYHGAVSSHHATLQHSRACCVTSLSTTLHRSACWLVLSCQQHHACHMIRTRVM